MGALSYGGLYISHRWRGPLLRQDDRSYSRKERDVESQYDYFGARYYDSRVGRWLSVDPLSGSHPDYTSYSYVYNNPLRLTDPSGLDSAQRAAAVEKALDYVKRNPGDSYPSVDEKKQGLFKGSPGEKVDCAGMMNGCVLAGGEESIYVQNKETGVECVKSASDKVGNNALDIKGAQEGNILTLNNTRRDPLDPTKDDKHTGMLTSIDIAKDGSILNATMSHSSGVAGSGKSGPKTDYLIKDGNVTYWGRRVTGLWKWDTVPDRK
jgi:RHS repeat-associated protein